MMNDLGIPFHKMQNDLDYVYKKIDMLIWDDYNSNMRYAFALKIMNFFFIILEI